MVMLLSFVIVIAIVTITIVSVSGYYKNGRCKSSIRMMSLGRWPPLIIEDSNAIKHVDINLPRSSLIIEDSNAIKHVNSNSAPNSNESSETILITTLSGALASWFISHEFTSVMIGTLLANSLAERRDSIGSTTRTFGTKVKELKNELDRIFASNKKIVKTPHRFESNKAGLQDPRFWKEAYSAVSYTLGNDLKAREQHLVMMKQIVEEEEKIVLKQKIEKEIVDVKKNEEIKVINYKKDVKKISWKPKLNLEAVLKGVSDNIYTVQQQSISTIDEWKRIELASSSLSSSSLSSTTNDFPQQISSMSYKQKGRMQLAAVSTSTYSDYDSLIQTDEVKIEETNNIASELNIEPVLTENVSESDYLHNPNADSIVSTYNPNTEDDVIIAEEKVETIDTENKFLIIDSETTLSSSDEYPSEDAIVDYQQDIIKVDRFNQESDLERFRKWGHGIEWDRIKLAGSNLYYHIQKDKVSLSEEKFASRPTTKSIVLNQDDRSSFVRDVLQKATLKSNTYKYYRGLVDK